MFGESADCERAACTRTRCGQLSVLPLRALSTSHCTAFLRADFARPTISPTIRNQCAPLLWAELARRVARAPGVLIATSLKARAIQKARYRAYIGGSRAQRGQTPPVSFKPEVPMPQQSQETVVFYLASTTSSPAEHEWINHLRSTFRVRVVPAGSFEVSDPQPGAAYSAALDRASVGSGGRLLPMLFPN